MQVELEEIVKEILRESRDMNLATASGNTPWATTLVFGHDENFNLYWISRRETRHSRDIVANNKVATTVTIEPSEAGKSKGLQIEGKAKELTSDAQISAAREFFAKRNSQNLPKSGEEAIPFNEESAWYVLQPSKIYIIDEARFGFERKELAL